MAEKWEKLVVEYQKVDIDKELQVFGNYFTELGSFEEENNQNLVEFFNTLIQDMFYFHINARPYLDLDYIDPLRYKTLNIPRDIVGYTRDILGHDIAQHTMGGVLVNQESDGQNSYYERLVEYLPQKLKSINLYEGNRIMEYFRKNSQEVYFGLFCDISYKEFEYFRCSTTVDFQHAELIEKFRFEFTLQNFLYFLHLDKSINHRHYDYDDSSEFFTCLDRDTQEKIFNELKNCGKSSTLEFVKEGLMEKNWNVKKALLDRYNGEHRFQQLINLEQQKIGMLSIINDLELMDAKILEAKISAVRNNIAFWNQLYQDKPDEFYPDNINPIFEDYNWDSLYESYKKLNLELEKFVNYLVRNKDEIIITFFQVPNVYNKLHTHRQNYKKKAKKLKFNCRLLCLL